MYFDKPKVPKDVKEFIVKWPVYREDVDDPNFKTQAQIREIQNRNLKRQIGWCAEASLYYRELFKKADIDPASIQTVDDLDKLPLTHKRDYMANPDAFRLKFKNPTIYDFLYDLTYTTGTTTGMPTPFYNTTYDIYDITKQMIRGLKVSMTTPEDVVMNLFPYGPIPHIGYFRTITLATSIGARLVCAHTGIHHPDFPIHRSTQRAIELIEQHRCTVLSGIGSYLRRLIMLAEEGRRDFSSVRTVAALGEAVPRGMRDDMRTRLSNMGAKDVFINNAFGFTESQVAFPECYGGELNGSHNPGPDSYFMEVVDEKSGKRLPDGEVGLVCITHLNRRGTVLLRYVIGDLAALTHETCPNCGRNCDRLVIKTGSTYATRTSELLNIKGTLVNPEIMKNEISNIPGVGEYQIVVTKKDLKDPYSPDELIIRVAAKERAKANLERDIIDKVLLAAEMRPRVEFVELSDIFDPAKSLKATRVVDMRPKE